MQDPPEAEGTAHANEHHAVPDAMPFRAFVHVDEQQAEARNADEQMFHCESWPSAARRSQRSDLGFPEGVGQWIPTIASKALARDLDAGRSLAPFVLRRVDQSLNTRDR